MTTQTQGNWILKGNGWQRKKNSATATHTPNPNWITNRALQPDLWKREDGTIDWNGYYEYRKKVGLSK